MMPQNVRPVCVDVIFKAKEVLSINVAAMSGVNGSMSKSDNEYKAASKYQKTWWF